MIQWIWHTLLPIKNTSNCIPYIGHLKILISLVIYILTHKKSNSFNLFSNRAIWWHLKCINFNFIINFFNKNKRRKFYPLILWSIYIMAICISLICSAMQSTVGSSNPSIPSQWVVSIPRFNTKHLAPVHWFTFSGSKLGIKYIDWKENERRRMQYKT